MKSTLALATALLALPLAGCGDGGDGGDSGSTTLTVFAAASLKGSFEELETTFEKAHPDVDVKLSFGGSSDLVAQVTDGAEADVLASADTKNMDKLTGADLAEGTPREFATNTLTIAVPPGNPGGVTGLADLAKTGLNIVVCAPEVPCGSAAEQVAEKAGVKLAPDSEEQSVTDVLGKIEAGEGDAGLVYVTDVEAAGDKVEAVTFPEADEVVNHYPIVAVKDSAHADLAQQWIDLVLGEGQAVLTAAGFGPPAA